MLHIPYCCCCKCFQLCILLLLFLLSSSSTCSPWGHLYRKHVPSADCRDTQVRPVAEHPCRIYHLCRQEAGNRDTQLGLLMLARSAQWTCAAPLTSEPFSSSSSPRPISMKRGGKYSVHGGALLHLRSRDVRPQRSTATCPASRRTAASQSLTASSEGASVPCREPMPASAQHAAPLSLVYRPPPHQHHSGIAEPRLYDLCGAM